MANNKPEASSRQKHYIIGLGKKVGQEIEMDDLLGVDTFEASSMIKKFKQVIDGDKEDPCDVQRKKIISMAKSIGWVCYDENQGKEVADMRRIYGWVLKYGYLKKGLNRYTEKEIPKLVSQYMNGPFAHKLDTN